MFFDELVRRLPGHFYQSLARSELGCIPFKHERLPSCDFHYANNNSNYQSHSRSSEHQVFVDGYYISASLIQAACKLTLDFGLGCH